MWNAYERTEYSRLFSISFENQTNFDINIDLLNNISNEFRKKEIEFILCDNSYIKKLNNQFRQKNTATDVLSFPYEDMPMTPLGSIVISLDYAKDKAHEYSHSILDEITLLYIHGLLHLLGYDHEIDDGQHRNLEEKLIKKYKLPNSLIIRNT